MRSRTLAPFLVATALAATSAHAKCPEASVDTVTGASVLRVEAKIGPGINGLFGARIVFEKDAAGTRVSLPGMQAGAQDFDFPAGTPVTIGFEGGGPIKTTLISPAVHQKFLGSGADVVAHSEVVWTKWDLAVEVTPELATALRTYTVTGWVVGAEGQTLRNDIGKGNAVPKAAVCVWEG